MIMVYYDYFHSIMKRGIIFLVNSPYSVEVFRAQNNIIRITTGCRSKYSLRDLFQTLKMLPISSTSLLISNCIFSSFFYGENKNNNNNNNKEIQNELRCL